MALDNLAHRTIAAVAADTARLYFIVLGIANMRIHLRFQATINHPLQHLTVQ